MTFVDPGPALSGRLVAYISKTVTFFCKCFFAKCDFTKFFAYFLKFWSTLCLRRISFLAMRANMAAMVVGNNSFVMIFYFRFMI